MTNLNLIIKNKNTIHMGLLLPYQTLGKRAAICNRMQQCHSRLFQQRFLNGSAQILTEL